MFSSLYNTVPAETEAAILRRMWFGDESSLLLRSACVMEE
jgi:hypothetical protein